MQTEPEAQVLHPLKPKPPHCPHLSTAHAEPVALEVVRTVEELLSLEVDVSTVVAEEVLELVVVVTSAVVVDVVTPTGEVAVLRVVVESVVASVVLELGSSLTPFQYVISIQLVLPTTPARVTAELSFEEKLARVPDAPAPVLPNSR